MTAEKKLDAEIWAWIAAQRITVDVRRKDGGLSKIPLTKTGVLWAMAQERK